MCVGSENMSGILKHFAIKCSAGCAPGGWVAALRRGIITKCNMESGNFVTVRSARDRHKQKKDIMAKTQMGTHNACLSSISSVCGWRCREVERSRGNARRNMRRGNCEYQIGNRMRKMRHTAS